MDKIIHNLSDRLDIKEELIEKVIKTQFDFIVDTIRLGEESVHLHYLGKFCIKPKAKERLQIAYDRRNKLQ